MRFSLTVNPEFLVESNRIHDQRVLFPVPDRMPVVAGLEILRVRPSIHIDRAIGMRTTDVEDVNQLLLGKLDELHSIRRDELPGSSRSLAPRMRLVAFKSLLAIIMQRPGPILERHVLNFDVV